MSQGMRGLQRYSIVVGIIAGLVAAGLVYAITGDRFTSDAYVWISALMLAAATINVGYFYNKLWQGDGSAKYVGALGKRMSGTASAALFAVSAVVTAAYSQGRFSIVLSSATLLALAISVVSPEIIGDAIEEIDSRITGSTAHMSWHDELHRIARGTTDVESRQLIATIADSARFASRDLAHVSQELEDLIDQQVRTLSSLGPSASLVEVKPVVSTIENYLKDRDALIARSRRTI